MYELLVIAVNVLDMDKDQRFVAFLIYYLINLLYAIISCGVVLICGVLFRLCFS